MNVDSEDYDFGSNTVQNMCCTCMGDDANTNLSAPQRELLLWHCKLGCSMKQVHQQLVVKHETIDKNNESVLTYYK